MLVKLTTIKTPEVPLYIAPGAILAIEPDEISPYSFCTVMTAQALFHVVGSATEVYTNIAEQCDDSKTPEQPSGGGPQTPAEDSPPD